MSENIVIDQAAIDAEIEKLKASGGLEAEYLKLRTRQKTQQKKQQGSGAMKAYQKKKQLLAKAIRAEIEKRGLADQLDAKAEEEAAKKHQEYLDAQPDETEEQEVA